MFEVTIREAKDEPSSFPSDGINFLSDYWIYPIMRDGWKIQFFYLGFYPRSSTSYQRKNFGHERLDFEI
jgi:hypothetical protein